MSNNKPFAIGFALGITPVGVADSLSHCACCLITAP